MVKNSWACIATELVLFLVRFLHSTAVEDACACNNIGILKIRLVYMFCNRILVSSADFASQLKLCWILARMISAFKVHVLDGIQIQVNDYELFYHNIIY